MTDQLESLSDATRATEFSVDLRFRTLRVAGEIDVATADRFETSLRYAFELGDPVCVDMSQVAFIDSNGIRALLRAATAREVRIISPSMEVQRVLEILGLGERFGLVQAA